MFRYLLFVFFLLIFGIANQTFSINSENNGSVSKKELKKQLKKARNLNYDGYYIEAREQYYNLLAYDSTNYVYNFELGNVLFYGTKEYELAIKHYERALKNNPNPPEEIYYTLAIAHHAIDHYETAYNYYVKFEQFLKNNWEGKWLRKEIAHKKAQCEYGMEQTRIDPTFYVENMGDSINTEFPEYIPITNEADSVLFFTSRRPSNTGNNIDFDDELYYEDMYIAFKDPKTNQYLKGKKVSRDEPYTQLLENTQRHESFVSLSYDEKTLVIYRDDKLWYSELINNSWSKPKPFPKEINFSKHVPHLSFTGDKKTVYFSAYTKKGKLDIYKSVLKDNNKWSKAEKLPPIINTSENEDAPEISPDGKSLFFSSSGLPGFGGYDIFKTTLDANGNWTTPVNMGHPVNSAADDIFLKFHKSEKTGYFASSRANSKGYTDIYKFRYLVRPQFDHCVSYDANKGYIVNFDATSTIFTGKENVSYLWDMGDETKYEGAKISHAYKKPNTYTVTLSIRDNNTKKIKENEQTYKINVVDFNYLKFDLLRDTVYLGENNNAQVFDGSKSYVPGGKINFVAWDFLEDDVVLDSIKLTRIYNEKGTYKAKFILEGTDPKGEKFVLCQTKPFVVTERIIPVLAENKEKTTPNTPEKNNTIDLGNNFNQANVNTQTIKSEQGKPELILNTIYFDFNSAALNAKAKEVLSQNIKVLKAYPEVVFNLSAHTDSKGSDEYNRALSKRRAIATYQYLIKNGIKPSRISATISAGESQPVAPNENVDGTDNPSGRALNRRVEFQIVGTTK
jgi:outer membrane protein OmpA-like peptidoglycan-associated protein/tetratricopeptide (TPR) repeat protein